MAESKQFKQIANTIVTAVQAFAKDYKGHLTIKTIVCEGVVKDPISHSDGLFHDCQNPGSYPVRIYKSADSKDIQKMLIALTPALVSLSNNSRHQILTGEIYIRINKNEKCDTIYLDITDENKKDVSTLKKNIETALAELNPDKECD